VRGETLEALRAVCRDSRLKREDVLYCRHSTRQGAAWLGRRCTAQLSFIGVIIIKRSLIMLVDELDEAIAAYRRKLLQLGYDEEQIPIISKSGCEFDGNTVILAGGDARYHLKSKRITFPKKRRR
jgi:hypothetical protein